MMGKKVEEGYHLVGLRDMSIEVIDKNIPIAKLFELAKNRLIHK